MGRVIGVSKFTSFELPVLSSWPLTIPMRGSCLYEQAGMRSQADG